MAKFTRIVSCFAVTILAWSISAFAASAGSNSDTTLLPIPENLLLLAPPPADGPVIVVPAFKLNDINRISDVEETFEFTGVLSLVWQDRRLAFQPTAGVDELVYQGDYQFDEIATGWYPTVVLANQSGSFEVSGEVLRIQADGTAQLVQTINATAEADMNMRLFPFDSHRFELAFQLLGFDRDEVQFQLPPSAEQTYHESAASLPHWQISDATVAIEDGPPAYASTGTATSRLVVTIEVERDSFYIRRLVTFPLAIIVVLSFSVFWMERSSLGDRTSVSFIGILTAVSYQLVMGNVLPEISYFTLMHFFLIFSFVTMCATVVVNLWIGFLDSNGNSALGDTIDRRCRWIFPLFYFGVILTTMLLRESIF